MAFRFTLQPLLRLRASFERLERLRLLALTALANHIRHDLSGLQAESAEARRKLQDMLAAGASGGELHFAVASEHSRSTRRQILSDKLAQVETRREKQRKVFEAARQKRRILENLRARRLAEYRREQLRREQKRVDELHLIHRPARPAEGNSE
ncbi:MAG TPA: flagellar export protein FliJ [Verrucomicrobiae bacterium]|nr:flagellar export protein FliJ [Verrucomicrobiae bacterium]